MHIIALSGALRRASYNTALLRAAAALAPDGVTIEVRTLHGIPLYDGDLEAEGIPAAVTTLREAIRAADGLLIATPEYNNSIPGVLKNGLDWLSRPSGEGARLFGGRPVAVVGATPGGFGTVQAQDAMLSVLRAFGCDAWFGGRLMLSHASAAFDADGHLTEEKLLNQLRSFIEGFVAHIRHRSTA
ncbi:NADPH-dependent FMN reductase [Roseateles puraquae]|uniref:NADPH-dependent FMN reductase n=1 Tax=Roseateles puraquae TaxID=431059 RepID=A0A254N9M8_9BURK|nr:NADPH-dependent FMN reductase [Roseateles puraquae]MDG0853894.1 NAD(P)H-dependent oxidoreductase [Roseateles puraquae]OWR04726.1 NADPH-dependent FMN reductase [Roseateles puraquae]